VQMLTVSFCTGTWPHVQPMVWAALALFVTISLALFLYINCSQVSSLYRPSKKSFLTMQNRGRDRLGLLGNVKLSVVSFSKLLHCFLVWYRYSVYVIWYEHLQFCTEFRARVRVEALENKRKENTRPFSINLMRSHQVSYRAAQD